MRICLLRWNLFQVCQSISDSSCTLKSRLFIHFSLSDKSVVLYILSRAADAGWSLYWALCLIWRSSEPGLWGKWKCQSHSGLSRDHDRTPFSYGPQRQSSINNNTQLHGWEKGWNVASTRPGKSLAETFLQRTKKGPSKLDRGVSDVWKASLSLSRHCEYITSC